MLIDLSGLATGYIIDRAFEAMVRRGCPRLLIDIGGDIRVGAAPPGSSGWLVLVAGLGKESPPICSLSLENCAVTTSGDLTQFVEIDGVRYSHLVDPRAGVPLTRRQSVTVLATTAIDADAGATALSVLGMEISSELFETLPLREAILLEADTNSTGDDAALRYRHLSIEER
jgi:thiamine biosynthesis lipoprotein